MFIYNCTLIIFCFHLIMQSRLQYTLDESKRLRSEIENRHLFSEKIASEFTSNEKVRNDGYYSNND